MKHKMVLAVGLLLAGSALGLAQDMLPPINADDVEVGSRTCASSNIPDRPSRLLTVMRSQVG